MSAILRGSRAKEGLTQEALAEKTGIEQADLSNIENGKLSIGRELGSSRVSRFY